MCDNLGFIWGNPARTVIVIFATCDRISPHCLGTGSSGRLQASANWADRLAGYDENNLVHSEGFQVYKSAHLGGQNENRWNRSCPRTAMQNRMLSRTRIWRNAMRN